jgi:tetratricopeptide (TPR) repeat protein
MLLLQVFLKRALFVAFLACFLFVRGADYLNLADRALLERRWDTAVNYYFKALENITHREEAAIWDDLGYAFLEKGQYQRALDYLGRAEQASPEDYDVRLYMAIAYFLSHEMDRAEACLAEISKNIYFDASWIEISAALNIVNEFGDRVDKDTKGRLRKEKGVTLFQKSKSTSVLVIDAFNEKNEGLFHYLRGLVFKQQGRDREAQGEFSAASRAGYRNSSPIGPSGQPTFSIDHRIKGHGGYLAWFAHQEFLKELELGKVREAVRLLDDALHIDQGSFEINHNLALLLYDTGDLEQAEIYCARALWFRENSVKDHELLGIIYFQHKEYARALAEFKRTAELDKTGASVYHNLGSVYYALGDQVLAESFWRKAIEREGRRDVSNSNAVVATVGTAALKHLLEVTQRPVSFLSYQSLGRLYLEQRLPDRAIDQLKKAMDLIPDDADIHLDMAKALLEKGLDDEAAGYLAKYFSFGGKNEGEAKTLSEKLKRSPQMNSMPGGDRL